MSGPAVASIAAWAVAGVIVVYVVSAEAVKTWRHARRERALTEQVRQREQRLTEEARRRRRERLGPDE